MPTLTRRSLFADTVGTLGIARGFLGDYFGSRGLSRLTAFLYKATRTIDSNVRTPRCPKKKELGIWESGPFILLLRILGRKQL